jgi:hypothetical protein
VFVTRLIPATAFALVVLGLATAHAQAPVRSHVNVPAAGGIEGRVTGERKSPLPGAMVSVVGRTTAVATTDRDGRYAFRNLPPGTYVLTVHSRGYWKSRGRTVHLTARRTALPEIQLVRASTEDTAGDEPQMLEEDTTQLAGMGFDFSAPVTAAAAEGETRSPGGEGRTDGGETAWRLRHLPRSILKSAAASGVWGGSGDFELAGWFGRNSALVAAPVALLNDLSLSGQFNLMTVESFDSPGQLFGTGSARNVAYLSVNTRAAGGAWQMHGAMTQGDLASWIVAGSYKSLASASHAYQLGLSYSTQRYDGGNVAALAAIQESARNVGTVYGFDQWTIAPYLILGYGTGYARYDYVSGPGLWSPRITLAVPVKGFRFEALASSRSVVPGEEEFAPSLTGLWLPPERTFSSVAVDGTFTPEHTRHLQLAIERDLPAGVTLSVRGFGQQVGEQLVEMFGIGIPGSPETPLGHYFVGSAGDVDARGWGVSLAQEAAGTLRSSVEYTVAVASWLPSAGAMGMRPGALTPTDRVHDLQSSVEATISPTATRIYAKYRLTTAVWRHESDARARSTSNRFNVRVNQALPFLRFSKTDWEMLLDVRNLFREAEAEASLYDELLALNAPKRIVGGLLVKF